LKKKLREIEELEKKKAEGKQLNEDETVKINQKRNILTQLNDLKVK